MDTCHRTALIQFALIWCAGSVCAHDSVPSLPPVVITGHYDNSVGSSDAASQGVIGSELLRNRALLRPAEVLEFIPGMTARVDPKTGLPIDRVPGLVSSRGQEVGVKTEVIPNLQSTLALWRLDFDSELVYVGDAGNTEAGRPSKRTGIEWSNHWTPGEHFLMDVNLAWTKPRYADDDPAGHSIVNATQRVANLTFALRNLGPWSGSLGVRYIGSAPLIENNSVRSSSSLTTNLRVTRKISNDITVQALLKAGDKHVKGGTQWRNATSPTLLRGLLFSPEGRAFTPAWTSKGPKQYRYYVNTDSIKLGKEACEVCRVPAGEIEGVVVEQLRGMLRSPEVLSQAVHEVTLARPDISETEAIRHLQSIDEVWEHLFPAEQARIAHALIERITVRKDGISIKWHTKGMPKFLRDSVTQPTYREAA